MYSLLIHFYAFIVAMISPFHRKARLMRFGQWKTNSILREKIDRNAKYIWFHASSLGEFEQGRPMIEKVKAQYPEYKILLTFFSPSGYEVRKNYNGADIVCYLPFDTPYRVKKFLNLANPAVAVFIKYEFWGNYLRELKKLGNPGLYHFSDLPSRPVVLSMVRSSLPKDAVLLYAFVCAGRTFEGTAWAIWHP